jgi:hypothetical protein
MATITITSIPSGAEVFDSSGTRLGKTPTEVGLPIDGTAHTFILRHPKAKEREKTITPTGDTTVEVPLERLPRSGGGSRSGGSGSGRGSGKASGKGSNTDIMEPGFLK